MTNVYYYQCALILSMLVISWIWHPFFFKDLYGNNNNNIILSRFEQMQLFTAMPMSLYLRKINWKGTLISKIQWISLKNQPHLPLLCLGPFYLANLQLVQLQAKVSEEIWQYPCTVAAKHVECQINKLSSNS